MKKGIFLALAALALAVFAVPEAYGKSGPDIDWQFSGYNFSVDDPPDEQTQSALSLSHVVAKGQPGTAQLGIQTRISFPPQRPFAGCPDDWFGAAVISQFVVATFKDGSILTGQTTDGFTCTPDFDIFTSEARGIITGGTGRFEDASGTWESTAFLQSGGTASTGSVTADLH